MYLPPNARYKVEKRMAELLGLKEAGSEEEEGLRVFVPIPEPVEGWTWL